MRAHWKFLAAAVLLAVAVRTEAEELDPQTAHRVLRAALAEAQRLGAPGGAIAVVDAGGHPVLVERLPGTFPVAAEISIAKARTAALFQRPTGVLENAINGGRSAMLGLAGPGSILPLKGGVPFAAGAVVIGAVGVSGAASADQDEEIAVAAAAALRDAADSAARFLEAPDVRDAFAAGRPLLETPTYKIHASRREGPGQAEVHVTDTDVFYVLGGSATFITGGTLSEAEEVAPNEIRAPSIRGGESRRIGPGEVVVVPAGVPHWFQAVDGPMTYYVVKVTEGAR